MRQLKSFEIRAEWDGEAGMWWCSNDELPLTTEAPNFEQLVSRVLEIALEIAAENGLAAPGDDRELRRTLERDEIELWLDQRRASFETAALRLPQDEGLLLL